ncbi:hypothetical protein [Altererythrobacter sp. MF3-039]|uniref:hypothetical protein n=1 Tax=Altererythrobacter sp. MF3-039 TaxID=3252901 RepID=UPI00390CC93A
MKYIIGIAAFVAGLMWGAILFGAKTSEPLPTRTEFPDHGDYVAAELAKQTDLRPHFVFPVEMEGLTASFYGFRVEGYLNVVGGSCLLVYLHGHHNSFADYDYYHQLKDAAAKRGCDTLAMDMVGIGSNAGGIWFPTRFGRLELSRREGMLHDNYRQFYDTSHPERTPLQLVLSGQYAIIQELAPKYDNIRMIGISGGGWSAVMLTAMMPEIERAVSWAGGLPHEYRLNPRQFGDFEQRGSFYDKVSYWQIYGMGGDRLTLVFNSADDCCFSDPEASAFKRAAGGAVNVLISPLDTHSIDPGMAEAVLYDN